MRNPSANPTPLDLASFYVESLKCGGGAAITRVDSGDVSDQLEVLLRDAGVDSMTGEQVEDAMRFYGANLSRTLGIPRLLAASCFLDGLMHGIALAAGLEGEHRNPRLESGGTAT